MTILITNNFLFYKLISKLIIKIDLKLVVNETCS